MAPMLSKGYARPVNGLVLMLIAWAAGFGLSCGSQTGPSEPAGNSAEETGPGEGVLEIRICGRQGVNIRTGPGTNYRRDRNGPLMLGENLHVLERKGDWLRFRVTAKDTGWSGWVRQDFTLTEQEYEQRHDELWEAFDRSQGIR